MAHDVAARQPTPEERRGVLPLSKSENVLSTRRTSRPPHQLSTRLPGDDPLSLQAQASPCHSLQLDLQARLARSFSQDAHNHEVLRPRRCCPRRPSLHPGPADADQLSVRIINTPHTLCVLTLACLALFSSGVVECGTSNVARDLPASDVCHRAHPHLVDWRHPSLLPLVHPW